MKPPTAIPRAPLLLGLLGLVPFYASAGYIWFGTPFSAFSIVPLQLYGALIVTFLGGVRWGTEVASRPDAPSLVQLIGSVVASLFSWALLMAYSNYGAADREYLAELGIASLALLAVSHALHAWWDVRAGGVGGVPVWYPRLRIILSIGAIIAIALGIAGLVGR